MLSTYSHRGETFNHPDDLDPLSLPPPLAVMVIDDLLAYDCLAYDCLLLNPLIATGGQLI